MGEDSQTRTAGGQRGDGRADRGPIGVAVSDAVRAAAGATASVARTVTGFVRQAYTRPASRRTASALALLAVTLGGVALSLILAGQTREDVGPFAAEFSFRPSVSGGTEVKLPPLGALHVQSHRGPAHLEIDLASLDSERTLRLLNQPNGVEAASATAVEDLTRGVVRLALQSTGAAVLGAMALAALVFRSMRRVAICGGLAVLVMATSLATAVGTFRREAISEPRYEGLLINARHVVGDARRIVDQYDAYRDQLQGLVTNVGRLYTTIRTLPVYVPPDGTIKVLHVSDLHLNPAAWSVIRTVVQQFEVNLVIDTGDITDWGSEPESSFVAEIAALGVPYVYVRGNHDSASTQAAVGRQPNAVVLDNGVAEVAGLRIAGIGDPRFTPDKSAENPDERVRAGLAFVGQQLAQTIQAGEPVDIALMHDPAGAAPLAGMVPLALAGHTHQREALELDAVGPSLVPRTQLLVQGSTGGAGLRGLEGEEPVPLELSVLYFGPDHILRAYDAISVGGAGLAEVTLERHVVDQPSADRSPGLRTPR
jgi:predicted phosphodiesterase